MMVETFQLDRPNLPLSWLMLHPLIKLRIKFPEVENSYADSPASPSGHAGQRGKDPIPSDILTES
jgi:hypothetical protein